MKDQNNYLKNDNCIDDIIKSRKAKINLKYFSPFKRTPNKVHIHRNILNKNTIKELTKLSDRPNFVNKQRNNISNIRYISEDRVNEKKVYNSSMINNRQREFGNANYKRNIVIFTERPKKISDYILKNNNKQKVYQLTYLSENDLNYGQYLNENIKQNYNSNREYYKKLLKKQKNIFNLDNFDDDQIYLMNDIYNDNYNDIKRSKTRVNTNYSTKTLYTNNQNNDQLKVVKIQSVWRGYYLRRFLVKKLKKFYKDMKIFNSLYMIFYNNYKPSFIQFMHLLKKKNNNQYNNNITKKNINKTYANTSKNRYLKENKNIIKPSKENKNLIMPSRENKNIIKTIKENNNNNNNNNNKITAVIERKNINVFIPGEKKNEPKKYIIYKRKKNSPKYSPIMTKKKSKIVNKDKNLKIKAKPKNYDGFKNLNYKNRIKNGVNNFINFFIKKNLLLYCPLFLYRMRILEKMKIVEHKYKCLLNLIIIKKRVYLYEYFHKYRNIIFSKTLNQIFSKKMININKYIINKHLDKLKHDSKENVINNKHNVKFNLNNKNNPEDKVNNLKDNINQNNLKNNENINNNNNNNLNKKINILNKIINQKESKINKFLLNNIFSKWRDISNDIFVVPKLNQNKNKNRISLNKYKSAVVPKKKFIKVRKVKNDYTNNFSHTKSVNSGKISAKSFESDNINIRKMKIKKVNILLESKEIQKDITKELNFKNMNSEMVDNSYFIQKIANITKKISNKNNIFKCFTYWKKKSKENM